MPDTTTTREVAVRETIEPRAVTIPDAARALGIGRSTVYDLIGLGELETITIGTARRVTVRSIDSLVERGHVATPPRRGGSSARDPQPTP